jgi:phospholipase/carboxylesterase
MNVEQHETKDLVYLLITPDDYDQGRRYPMIILLHGFGASMQDLAAITPLIDRNNYIYVCPNAPIEVDIGPGLPGYSMVGYSWVPPRGEATEEDIRATKQTLEQFFSEIIEEHNAVEEEVILLGFSQGGSMTYRCSLSRPDLFAGAIILSSSFPEDAREHLPGDAKPPIFIAHGLQDNIERARNANEVLLQNGYNVQYEEYPIGHEITQQVIDDVVGWIKSTLAV